MTPAVQVDRRLDKTARERYQDCIWAWEDDVKADIAARAVAKRARYEAGQAR